MPASIRIIRIIKDKDPISGEEKEDYTAEIEVEAEDSGRLAIEVAKCPYGPEMAALLERAEFLTKESITKEEAQAEQEKLDKREEELRQEGYTNATDELMNELKRKAGTTTAVKILEKYLATKDEEEEEDE